MTLTRMLSSNQLESEREALGWRIAQLVEGVDLDEEEECTSTRLSGIGFLQSWQEEIDEELARREKISNRPTRTGTYPKVDRFKQLKDRVRLEDFYEQFTPNILRMKGRMMWGLCPMPHHHEDTPSFKIDPERQNWYCFGCHSHGDLFQLAMYVFQVSTNYEALCELERHYKVSQPLYSFPARPRASEALT